MSKKKTTKQFIEEACDIFFNNDKFYNPDNLTYWGCKLFDNETDARKSFG